jgi:hypothetical protein
MKYLLWLFLSLSIVSLQAKEMPKKYNLSICAIFKDEAQYLREWIEYHRLIGVDHFYLYDNGSKDDFKSALKSYIKADIVTLISWPDRIPGALLNGPDRIFLWPLGVQIPAYENAIQLRAVKETKWLAFLDISEFLVPSYADHLKEIIEQYDDQPGVVLFSDFFDASKLDALPRRKLVIETVSLTSAPLPNPESEVAKFIFKPDQCKGFTWPPYQVVFQDNQTPFKLKKQEIRINHYLDRFKGYHNLKKKKDVLHFDNRLLSDEETYEFLRVGYEIEDQERAIQRFIPPLLKRLGL